MTYVKIGGNLYPASLSGVTVDSKWDGRWSKTITLAMTHAEATELFTDNVPWSVVRKRDSYTNEQGETITPEDIELDNSEFCVAGEIVDHRDGIISVKMGKMTELETAYALLYGGETNA